jgi:hypothetical protein
MGGTRVREQMREQMRENREMSVGKRIRVRIGVGRENALEGKCWSGKCSRGEILDHESENAVERRGRKKREEKARGKTEVGGILRRTDHWAGWDKERRVGEGWQAKSRRE